MGFGRHDSALPAPAAGRAAPCRRGLSGGRRLCDGGDTGGGLFGDYGGGGFTGGGQWWRRLHRRRWRQGRRRRFGGFGTAGTSSGGKSGGPLGGSNMVACAYHVRWAFADTVGGGTLAGQASGRITSDAPTRSEAEVASAGVMSTAGGPMPMPRPMPSRFRHADRLPRQRPQRAGAPAEARPAQPERCCAGGKYRW